MNKTLSNSIAPAVLGGVLAIAAFSSCSNSEKDLYDPRQAAVKDLAREVKNQYAAAFIAEYGNIYATNTWGFDLNGNMTRATEGITLPTAPASPADADFAATVPAGVELYPNGYKSSNGSFYADNTVTNINFQGAWNNEAGHAECGKLYIVGEVTPSEFYLGAGTSHWDGNLGFMVYDYPSVTLYLCAGSTLNLTTDQAANLQGGVKIYIAEGAKLTISDNNSASKIVLNSTEVYNKGSIEAYNIELNGQGLLYNCPEGTITVDGNIKAANHNCKMVNEGTTTCTSFGTEGSAALWNIGTMTVNGPTIIDSNCATFVNDGKYTTTTLAYTAGSTNVYNACWLTVTETLSMTLGDTNKNCFYVGGNGAVVAKRVEMRGPGYIKLGAKAMLQATEEILVDCTKDEYGIHAIGSDYAVVTAPRIVKGTDDQGYEVSYSGKLYVATDSHFEQGYSGTYPYIHIMDGDVQMVNGTLNAPISIPASECSPGYGGTVPEVNQRVWAEDLGTIGDFDFNDVVFDVISTASGTNVIIQAAGGTLPINLTIPGLGTIEVHQAMGFQIGTNGKYPMINTGMGETSDPVTISSPERFTAEDVVITVQSNIATYALEANPGEAPQKICVPANVQWCREKVNIKKSYPNFGDYVTTGQPEAWWE